MIAQTVFAAAIVASVSAGWESKTGSCNTGEISCCNLDKQVEESTGKNDALISTGDIASQIGVQCDQVPLLIGVAIEDECKNTPVSRNLSKYSTLNTIRRSVVKVSSKTVSLVLVAHHCLSFKVVDFPSNYKRHLYYYNNL